MAASELEAAGQGFEEWMEREFRGDKDLKDWVCSWGLMKSCWQAATLAQEAIIVANKTCYSMARIECEVANERIAALEAERNRLHKILHAEIQPNASDKFYVPPTTMVTALAEITRLRDLCQRWGQNYQSWVDGTKAAEQDRDRLAAELAAKEAKP